MKIKNLKFASDFAFAFDAFFYLVYLIKNILIAFILLYYL